MWGCEYTLEPLLCSESPSAVPCLPVSVVASTLGHTPSEKASFPIVCFLFYRLLCPPVPKRVAWPVSAYRKVNGSHPGRHSREGRVSSPEVAEVIDLSFPLLLDTLDGDFTT